MIWLVFQPVSKLKNLFGMKFLGWIWIATSKQKFVEGYTTKTNLLPSKKCKNPYITIIHLNILPWEYETPSNKSATPMQRFILKKWSPNVVCCCISFGHSFLNCYSNLKLDVFNTLKGLQFCYLTLTVFPWASCMFLASSDVLFEHNIELISKQYH